MNTIKLTAAQQSLLTRAADDHAGKVIEFPTGVHGGARNKMLQALLARELVRTDGGDWLMTAAGYAAINMTRPGPISEEADEPIDLEADPTIEQPPVQKDPAVEADVAIAEASFTSPVRTRQNTKQAVVIEMLRRPEGATIAQICEATQWQSHTVRGTFAGALKKKSGSPSRPGRSMASGSTAQLEARSYVRHQSTQQATP
jgi:hypothetical protein